MKTADWLRYLRNKMAEVESNKDSISKMSLFASVLPDLFRVALGEVSQQHETNKLEKLNMQIKIKCQVIISNKQKA